MKQRVLSCILFLLLALVPLYARAEEPCTATKTGQHSWSDWVTTEPTCTEPGTRTRQCMACHQVQTEQTAPALGHAWNDGAVTTAPTCTAEGVRTFTCTRCGATTTQAIPAAGHVIIAIEGKAATCTEAGLTDGSKCSVCGEVLKAQEEIPATGHSVTITPGRGATCTEEGMTDGQTCSICGETIRVQKPIPALGHSWSGWTVKQPATCTEGGIEAHTCTVCGMEETRPTEALGHSWDHGIVTQEPSGFTPGVKYFTCLVCGKQRAERLDPTEALFDQLRGVTPRSPQENALRIVEQPSDGYASRIQGNHEWQYLKVVAEGGQQPYTYQWYYKPLFTSLGSGLTGSVVSDWFSSKVSDFADAVDHVKNRTRPAASKLKSSWLSSMGVYGAVAAQMGNALEGASLNSSGWGGQAIQGATKDSYEAYDIGQYYCVVTDDQGRHVTSHMAKVAQGVYITEQPEAASLYGKTSVALHCAAAGGSGNYEFFLLDKEYNGEGESDDEMSISRHIGTEASIPVTRPGKYYFWVDNLVEGGTNGTCISHTATVIGEPLAPQPDAPQPGTDTTGTTYGGDEFDATLTGNWFTAYEGMALQLTLKEDGTYAAAFPVQPESERRGTWRRVDNDVYLDGSTFPDLVLEEDGPRCTAYEGILRRTLPETYVPAELQADAPLESFARHWRAEYAAIDGVLLSADALTGPVDVLIEGTNVALGGDLFGDAIVSMAYADGRLSVSHDGLDLALGLQQDGFLRLTLAADADTVTLYLLP